MHGHAKIIWVPSNYENYECKKLIIQTRTRALAKYELNRICLITRHSVRGNMGLQFHKDQIFEISQQSIKRVKMEVIFYIRKLRIIQMNKKLVTRTADHFLSYTGRKVLLVMS